MNQYDHLIARIEAYIDEPNPLAIRAIALLEQSAMAIRYLARSNDGRVDMIGEAVSADSHV